MKKAEFFIDLKAVLLKMFLVESLRELVMIMTSDSLSSCSKETMVASMSTSGLSPLVVKMILPGLNANNLLAVACPILPNPKMPMVLCFNDLPVRFLGVSSADFQVSLTIDLQKETITTLTNVVVN